ncbi:dihydroorotase family protein [Amycolatopsis acidiphila]|uniref:Dihydroorotase family protein n=1 Tax=Amycolatopsis acidiphila TaxID=715473 RepID=A0A558ANN9_9PSEU|nr:dihydroorotase family protein [Amycolatopsis acidiphila]TVT25875.1 dihydroorotase family protein [Amycolatopsis acidiphila]UIJ63430.1 dihydroorotase family protein [Amycolatopsis acidiphila]GHG75571.1 cyclic amidohydrolase [Amycolatopsis acidiphila]
MRLHIVNGQLVTPAGILDGDLLCTDGTITAILDRGAQVDADEVYDAAGKLVFPGFIDPHVHSRDPGLSHKEDFDHSTRGALVGGVTTVLEMPNAIPPVDSAEVFEQRRRQHEQSAWTDFGLWGLALGDANLDQIGPMFEAGAVAVKLFWGYALHRETRSLVYNLGDEKPENLLMPPPNGQVLQLFAEVAKHGGVLAAHCEDKDVLATSQESLGHPIETYEDLLAARPAVAEATTISIAAQFAKATGCRFHVVHLASEMGLDVVRTARRNGVAVSAETCPQYLTLTDADYPKVGPVMKVYPPVREQRDQDALWAGVNDGAILSLGSDHAPHTVEEKARGFETQPAGAVGCETFGPVLLDALARGKTTAMRLAEVASTQTAKFYGLYPRKGVIRPGSDADLVIVDPELRRTVRNEELIAKQPVSPWNGFELCGGPVATVLRGEVVVRDREIVGERRGRFVRADHSAGHADRLSA